VAPRLIPPYLALVHYGERLRQLDAYALRELGEALVELGQRILQGEGADVGTTIVPVGRRLAMKVSFDVTKSGGGKYFEFALEYHDLPEPYVWDIASKATAFSKAVENTKGKGGGESRGRGGDKTYTVTFKWGGEAQRGEAKADGLQYSDMVRLQDAGIDLLKQLLQSAHLEIASGQRS
jgi:hypothetical protein